MIDTFSLLVSHGLLLLACWRLIWRTDLDQESPPPPEARRPAFGRVAATPPPQQSPSPGEGDA